MGSVPFLDRDFDVVRSVFVVVAVVCRGGSGSVYNLGSASCF